MNDAPKTRDLHPLAFAMLGLPSRFGRRLKMPLKPMRRLLDMAYYREGRRMGWTAGEIAQWMEMSVHKVNKLSQEFKAHFAEPSSSFGLERQILNTLWAEPATHSKVVRALEMHGAEQVEQTLSSMLERGLIAKTGERTPRYVVATGAYDTTGDRWLARLDALEDLMDAVSSVIAARFVRGDARAFARTIQLDIHPDDFERLQTFFNETFFPLLVELDQNAGTSNASVRTQIVMFWAPDESEEEKKR